MTMARGRVLLIGCAATLIATWKLQARAEGPALPAPAASASVSASASATPPPLPPKPTQFAVLAAGVHVGGAYHHTNGAVLGGVVSVVGFHEGLWVGISGDAVRDLGLSRTRVSLGPEMGLGPFGINVGYVVQYGDEVPMRGWRIHGVLATGLLNAYLGPGQVRNETQSLSFWEGGLTLRLPLLSDPPVKQLAQQTTRF